MKKKIRAPSKILWKLRYKKKEKPNKKGKLIKSKSGRPKKKLGKKKKKIK